MQFLKTLFWVLIAVVGAIFSYNNWHNVDIKIADSIPLISINLPLLLLLTFLAGLLPALALHRATRWSLRRRIDSMERSIAETRAPEPAAPVPVAQPPVTL